MSRRYSNKTLVVAVLTLLVVCVVSFVAGKRGGEISGQQAKARLELVWPQLMTLPDDDRALLAGFAIACRVEQQPETTSDVIACLRSAAADPDAIKPKGMGSAEAAARLEYLIETAQGK